MPELLVVGVVACSLIAALLVASLFVYARERRHMRARLRHAEEMSCLGRLVGGVAHDFNNLLSGILGSSELALDYPDLAPELRERLDLIRDTSARAAELTRELLSFSRRNQNVLIPVNMHVLLDNVCRLISHGLDRGIAVNASFAAADYTVLADVSRLQNLFLNLAANARDAMPSGGVINIATRNRVIASKPSKEALPAEGNFLEITISDTGQGIASKHLSHIFEPFYTTKDGKGSGLGLASARETMQCHNGNITVSSVPGRGTVFKLLFPVAQTAEAPVREPVKPASPPASRRAVNVLVVEDDPAVSAIIAQTLKAIGHESVCVSGARHARECIEAAPDGFDVAIVDHTLPELSGPTCIHMLREIVPEMPVIVTSGFSREDVEEATPAGKVLYFLQKPFGRQQLEQILSKVLEQSGADR